MRFFNRDGDQAELVLYDEIGAGFFGEGITAKSFADELATLSDVRELTIRINSPGGDVFDGLTIYNALARFSGRTVAVVEGLAASIASVIFQAADERRIADNAFVMVHDPHAFGGGTAEELRTLAGALDRTRDAILGAYVKRAGETRRGELSDAMSAETWFDAGEALNAGLADAVDEPLELAASYRGNWQNFADPENRYRWRHAPDKLLNTRQSGHEVSRSTLDRSKAARKFGAVRERLAALKNRGR